MQISRLWLFAGGLGASVLTAYAVHAVFGEPVMLLLCATALLIMVVMLMWNSLQALSGDAEMSLEEALSLAAPPAEEEQKRAVLRSLKDLEYEKRVGKIRDDDYRELTTRYRGEAKNLLGQLDERYAPARKRVEDELAGRLRRDLGEERIPTKEEATDASATESDSYRNPGKRSKRKARGRRSGSLPPESSRKSSEKKGPSRLGAAPGKPTRACQNCSARQDLLADVCSACSEPMTRAGEVLCRACPSRYDQALARCPECGVPAEGKA